MSEHLFTPDERGLIRTCPQCSRRNRLNYDRLGHVLRCGSCKTELSSPSEPLEPRSIAVFDALIGTVAVPVLVDFWASWCGPCKMIAPEVLKVAQAGTGRWLVVKVNTETLPELASRFRISGIPTLTLFLNGHEIARESGAMPAPAMIKFIQNTVSQT